jgi:hypothetical protein
MMNWKGFGRKRRWTNRDAVLEFAWHDGGKPRETSVIVAGVLAEIRRGHPE